LNVCILSPFAVLPPITGARRRVYEIATALRESGTTTTVLHPARSELLGSGVEFVGFAGLETLTSIRDSRMASSFDTYLSSTNLLLHRKLVKILRKQGADILQIEGPWGIFACRAPLALHRIPLVYDAHNVESISVRQSSSVPWMGPYARFAEKRAAEDSNAVFCVSELDKGKMCDLYHLERSKVTVIPNGVRISNYSEDSGKRVKARHGLSEDRKIVLFHGALGWRANARAADVIVESIAPRMKTVDPHVVFLIVGPQASKGLLKRAERKDNVRILGPVSDIADYVCSADVCIAPMEAGSGTKLKILEYLAARRPLVATRVAVEGIGIGNGKHALLANTFDDEFVRLIKIAMTPETSKILSSNAGAFVRQFDWSAIVKKILRVYETIAA
jgi:glycosyltransferase involved in cell wall biosynthesis